MEAIIFTTTYNQVTNLSQNSLFEHNFVHRAAIVCEGTLVIGKNDLFFGTHSSVLCSTRKFSRCRSSFFSYFSPRKYYFWEYKDILSELLNVYCKNWLLAVILQRHSWYWGKWPFPWYVGFSNFLFQKFNLCWINFEIYLLIFLLENIITENRRTLSKILNV